MFTYLKLERLVKKFPFCAKFTYTSIPVLHLKVVTFHKFRPDIEPFSKIES